MYISKLLLENFRSYDKKLFEFESGFNLILGPNGCGKTNILEAIFLLSSGKSFRSSSLPKLIQWNKIFSSVRLKVVNSKSETNEVEVELIKDPTGQKSTISRKFLIDKVEKNRKNFIGVLKTVIFHPEDTRLVTGSPSRRRDFFDSLFLQVEWRYASALSQFNRALRHRNELLDQIKLGRNSKSELFYWDQALIKNANIIHDFRVNFVRSVNLFFANHSNSQINTISLNYHPSLVTQEKLDRNYQHELNSGYTIIGTHRDDFSLDNSIFPQADKNLAFWGSRGQQRLAVLAVRLAQIDYLEKTYNDTPVLLLDDIFSELDEDHQKLVVSVCRKYQTIFTSSEKNTADIMGNCNVIQL